MVIIRLVLCSLTCVVLSCSAALFPSSHATTGATIDRSAIPDTVVGDQKVARITVEGLEWHSSWREEVLANGYKLPWREWVQTARKPVKDPLLHVVQGFVGHRFLKLAVHHPDVDALLIRAVCARVGRKIADRSRGRDQIRNFYFKVVTKQPH